MPAFLAEDNLCGKTLLQLVSRGNSIITELCRLAQNIPPYLSHLYTEAQGKIRKEDTIGILDSGDDHGAAKPNDGDDDDDDAS